MNNGPVFRTSSSISLANLETTGRTSPAPRAVTSPAPALPPGETLESLMEAGQLRRHQIEQRDTGATGAVPDTQLPAPGLLTLPPVPFASRRIGRLTGFGLSSLGALALGSSVSILIYAATGSLQSSVAYLLAPLIMLVGLGLLMGSVFLWPKPNGFESLASVRHQLRDWCQALDLPFSPRPWHERQIEDAAMILLWLEGLRTSLAEADEPHRQQVLSRVRYVVAALDEGRSLRRGLAQVVMALEHNPNDPISWGLDSMEIMVRNWRAAHGELSSAELFQIGRGMYRLETIRTFADRLEGGPVNLAERLNPDEVASELQYGLRDRLSLPINVSPPQHELQLLPPQFDMVGDAVLAMEQNISPQHALDLINEQTTLITQPELAPLPEADKNHLALFIAQDFEPWRNHVSRTARPEIRTLKTQVRDYQNRLDDPPENAPPLTEHDYLISANEAMFLHNHGVAYKKALMAMLES